MCMRVGVHACMCMCSAGIYTCCLRIDSLLCVHGIFSLCVYVHACVCVCVCMHVRVRICAGSGKGVSAYDTEIEHVY